jgi:hypothetical protein
MILNSFTQNKLLKNRKKKRPRSRKMDKNKCPFFLSAIINL